MDKNSSNDYYDQTEKDILLANIFNKYYYLVFYISKAYCGSIEAKYVCQEVFITLYLHYNMRVEDDELKALLIRLTKENSKKTLLRYHNTKGLVYLHSVMKYLKDVIRKSFFRTNVRLQ